MGRGARAGIPGRSCAGRGRGSEDGSGAHPHAGTRARTPGPRADLAGRPGRWGREGRGGAGPEVGGGRGCPDGD